MIRNIFKGLILGFLLFVFTSFLWYLYETNHIKTLSVKKCEHAAGQSLKTLSEQVKDNWFERKHNDIHVFSDGYPCMFFQFYPKPGVLYFGQEVTSGHDVGVAMTATQLHLLADTINANMNFQEMLDYLVLRAKTNPAPMYEFR